MQVSTLTSCTHESCVTARHISTCLLHAGYDETEAHAMFTAADTDGSGLVDLHEFIAWYKKEEVKQVGAAAVSQAGNLLPADDDQMCPTFASSDDDDAAADVAARFYSIDSDL